MKKFTALLILFLFALPLKAGGSSEARVCILCYHAFLDRKDIYSYSEQELKKQLNELKRRGFTFIKFEDLKYGRVHGKKNILLTSDDGNRSVYSAYFNIMKPMGIKPMLAIYPSIIGRKKYALSWDQLRELSAEGCHIAAHGFNHRFLTEKLYTKSEKLFMREIYLPKRILEEKLGRPVESFVYPYGATCPRAETELAGAGYRYAFTIVPKHASLPLEQKFRIPRFMMTKKDQGWVLASIYSSGRGQGARNSGKIKISGKKKKSAYRTAASAVPGDIKMNRIIIAPGKEEYTPKPVYRELAPAIDDRNPVYPDFSGKAYNAEDDYRDYTRIREGKEKKLPLSGIKQSCRKKYFMLQKFRNSWYRKTREKMQKILE